MYVPNVLEYRVILLLRTSAALLALSALALLIRPGTVIGLLGLTSSRELEWSFRLEIGRRRVGKECRL